MCIIAGGTAGALARLLAARRWPAPPTSLNQFAVGVEALERALPFVVDLIPEERLALPGIDERRADLLPAGSVVLATALELFGASSAVHSEWGLREGVVLRELGAPIPHVARASCVVARSTAWRTRGAPTTATRPRSAATRTGCSTRRAMLHDLGGGRARAARLGGAHPRRRHTDLARQAPQARRLRRRARGTARVLARRGGADGVHRPVPARAPRRARATRRSPRSPPVEREACRTLGGDPPRRARPRREAAPTTSPRSTSPVAETRWRSRWRARTPAARSTTPPNRRRCWSARSAARSRSRSVTSGRLAGDDPHPPLPRRRAGCPTPSTCSRRASSSPRRTRSSGSTWPDPSEDDIVAIGDALGLHPLTLEDVRHRGQRPKVELFEGYAFVAVRPMRLPDGDLVEGEVHALVGQRFLATLCYGDEPIDPEQLEHRWLRQPQLFARPSRAGRPSTSCWTRRSMGTCP